MIGRLTGIINIYGPDSIIIDVNGVGYLVYCPRSVLSQLQEGSISTISIETDIKQDSIKLYGFNTVEEKTWFNLLQSVQGVGAKAALNIIGANTISSIITAIITADKAAFQRIPGIGPKLAQRILLELADKLPKHLAENIGYSINHKQEANTASLEAISALANLGFNRTEATEAIKLVISSDPSTPLEELIRKGLKALIK
jgi:Holliday junction DNA helicase RuvA